MMKIFKYTIPVTDESTAEMYMIEQVLHVDQQEDPTSLVVWAIVNPETALRTVKFCVRGTGQPLTGTEGQYIGTVITPLGLVWHVFRSNVL